MEPILFPTPVELVRALAERSNAARDQLQRLCRTNMEVLVRDVAAQFRIAADVELLTESAFRWVEMYLVSRRLDEWRRFSGDYGGWTLFRTYLVVKAARLFLWDPLPDRSRLERQGFPAELLDELGGERAPPEGAALYFGDGYGFELRWYMRPLLQVSGDTVEHHWDGQRLWVLLADGCGKGWLVRILVAGVAELWRGIIRDAEVEPGAVFDEICRRVEGCLPDGFFVEAVQSRFSGGEAGVSSAGGGRFLYREGRGCVPQLRAYRGYLIGVPYGDGAAAWQEVWPFLRDFALTKASDGLYDQPTAKRRLIDVIVESLAQWRDVESVHTALVELVERSLATQKQHDDITIVTVRRL